MKTFQQLVLSLGLICFLSAASPAHSATLATDKAPEIATIPAGLPKDQDSVLRKQLAALTALRDNFGAVMEDYNKTPRTGIVVGSAQEAALNNKITAVNKARAAYISEVKKFNKAVANGVVVAPKKSDQEVANALAAERLRTIKAMSAYAHQLEWSAEKKARLDTALNKLGFDGDPNVTGTQIRRTWKDVVTRGQDAELAREASQGDGLGFPGAGTQTVNNDCAVFALANAAGLPYGVVAARATDLIRQGEWRDAAERANPQAAIEQKGLKGGEVVMLAEAFGWAEVVPSSDFARTLKAGRSVMVNVVPADGDMNSGHEVVLTKTFQHGGETWFAMMDSNQGPQRRLFLSGKELNTILQENGVMFQPEPNRTPVLLREK